MKNKPVPLFACLAVVLSLCAIIGVVRAKDATRGPGPLKVTLEREPVALVDPRYQAYVTDGSNNFAFRVPPGYRLTGDPGTGTLTLGNREGNSTITFTIYGSALEDGQGLSPEVFRELLLNQYSSATITREFNKASGSSSGPGFDLQWKASGEIVECKRLVYLATPAGVLEFAGTADRNNFSGLKSALDFLLGTLMSSKDGKVKIPPMLDKI